MSRAATHPAAVSQPQ